MTKPENRTTRVGRDNSHLSDPIEAAYLLSRRFNISQLARLMSCKRPTTLNNKFNPACEDHHLTLSEALSVTELTNDNGILEAWAMSRGKALVDIPTGVTCDEELADLVMIVSESVAQVFAAYREARKDGVIDKHERRDIGHRVQDAIRDLLSLDAEIGGQVRELRA